MNNSHKVKLKQKEWYIDKMHEYKVDYFMTVTFKNHFDSYDKEISYFLREMHKSIFGNNFMRSKLFLPIMIVKEVGEYSDRPHYHFVVNSTKYELSQDEMVNGFVEASRKTHGVKSIKDTDIRLLTLDRQNINIPLTTLLQKRHGSVRYPLSCTPIETCTEHTLFGYMFKKINAHNNPVWLNGGTSEKDRKVYFNITT